ncbi:M20/M25/M40 family metallo-hydrolase [Paenarthrobacter sp. DKR-5]|uniref:M20/M25/M40 family metallo-hydrolase n=1 Tax=Paenarthrobacter sp. DKR-5 TaxID=2835535 RepID=UPI001BDD6B24|nr:M20/M25/M40 family metallo-hydrolase [Paenarthrobacter sp. DKR-5]MBT1004064.1 M20/M25/M40 family metallo-hydrolase [Paenarthrobacter sp. DKR-5]
MEPSPSQPSVPVEALTRSVDEGFPLALQELKTLVAVPGIAWPAFDPSELRLSADLVAGLAAAAGLSDVRILAAATADGTPGSPAVLARKPAQPGWPTVLLYAHHDVQPPGERAEWESEPFAAVERDGRLWGRGVADDKSGIITHLAAFRALTQVLGDDVGLGVTLFVEGEEEAGSPSLAAFLDDHEAALRADVAVVADSGVWQVGVPALTTSLRGLIDGTIELRALGHGLHSGTYGGPALDAVTLLAQLIASFHDATGAVAVDGLASSDTVDADMTEESFRLDARIPDSVRLAGTGPITARLWNKPALAITGIDAPAVAVASNTLIPSARAKVSLRLAPGDSPGNAFEAMRTHIEAHTPMGAEVTFTPGRASSPFAADTTSPAVRGALWAMREAWHAAPVLMGVGGSIPIVAALAERYPQAQILITGAEDPDTRAHGANESLHLGEFRRSILAETLLLAQLALAKS